MEIISWCLMPILSRLFRRLWQYRPRQRRIRSKHVFVAFTFRFVGSLFTFFSFCWKSILLLSPSSDNASGRRSNRWSYQCHSQLAIQTLSCDIYIYIYVHVCDLRYSYAIDLSFLLIFWYSVAHRDALHSLWRSKLNVFNSKVESFRWLALTLKHRPINA